MRIVTDLGLVRVVSGGNPFKDAYDIVVEQRLHSNHAWMFYQGFNSLSDDYAYTNAKECAFRLVKQMAEEIAERF